MIGGKVIETIVGEDRVWINCQDYVKSTGELRDETCAIFVKKTPEARSVSEGDVIWWQGEHALWTAKDRFGKTIGKPDTKLIKIGNSGVHKP